jgi:RNA polymerase sigma-54 factor
MKINIQEVTKALKFISELNPYPGRNFSTIDTKYVTPDAYVYIQDDALVVEMNEDILPALTINKYIDKIAKSSAKKKKLSKDERYVVSKIKNAKQFMSLINYRNSSLFKLVLILVNLQKEFFYKGAKSLMPLTMKEVADEIGLSESTISRLASSKYIQTEWGIHEIKYFFSNSIGKNKNNNSNNNDNETSAESVRETIKEIFENEKGGKISDQKIVEILQNKGIKIARRTVAKYRKMLNILPSHHRKQQNIKGE